MHRTDFDSHSTRLYLFEHRLSDFEKETSSINGRATVFILTKVRGAIHELSDQIEIVSLDLYAIKSGFHGILCRDPKFSNRAANFIFAHRARSDGRLPSQGSNTLLLRIHIGGRHRQSSIEEVGVRYRAGVPKLRVHQPAPLVDRRGHRSPSPNLLGAP